MVEESPQPEEAVIAAMTDAHYNASIFRIS